MSKHAKTTRTRRMARAAVFFAGAAAVTAGMLGATAQPSAAASPRQLAFTAPTPASSRWSLAEADCGF